MDSGVATATVLTITGRPTGLPHLGDFALRSTPLAHLGPDDVMVENRFLSVDPYMRARMDDRPSYYPPWPLDRPLDGDAIGVVTASRAAALPEGTWVASDHGLRDRFVAPASQLRALPAPPSGYDHSVYLSVLGGTGFTAWLGVTDILRPQPGECMFVTTAAGAVGSVAGQLCRLAGARVIGSTGSPSKAHHAESRYGFDAVFDYRTDSVPDALDELAPGGIHGMFDNVGGIQLEAALDRMCIGGRIAKCGAIAGYNDATPPPGPRNLHQFFARRLLMQGFLVSDHAERRNTFLREVGARLRAGEIAADHCTVNGLEEAAAAFLELFSGANVGKTIVTLDPVG